MKLHIKLVLGFLLAADVPCSGGILTKKLGAEKAAGDLEVQVPRKLRLYERTHQEFLPGLMGSLASPASLNPERDAQFISNGPALQNRDCHPKCFWSCGNAECDEVCNPVCAPPQCETACATINLASCRQRCAPPRCAIVCPTQSCEHGGCPECKTVCSPPSCHTECSEQCESKCSTPQCTWKCVPGKCEKPSCTLTCGGARACGLDGDVNARPPPFRAGMTVVAKGLASADPHDLLKPLAAKGQGHPTAPAIQQGNPTAPTVAPIVGSPKRASYNPPK